MCPRCISNLKRIIYCFCKTPCIWDKFNMWFGSSRCGFELNEIARWEFGQVGCFRVRFVLYMFPFSCVLAFPFCVSWRLEVWIAPWRASRKVIEIWLKKRAIRTFGEEDMTFGTFLELLKLTYLHSLTHIFFYKMNLEVRFVPLESILQELQFEHKCDLIWSSADK